MNNSDGSTSTAAAHERIVLEAAALTTADAPRRILVAPWGRVESSAGGFLVDDAAVKETIAAFQQHATDLPVDYEHQTLGGAYSSPTGQAPAAGWIKTLVGVAPDDADKNADYGGPGLWAEVDWTPDAKEKLVAKHYRYLSPVALVRRSDRRLVGLHSVALTNKPAIVGMKPVVNSADGAAPEESPPVAAAEALRLALGITADTDEETLMLAAVERLAELQRLETAREAEDRVAKAMAAGKLLPSQRTWAFAFARRHPEEFDAWEKAAPTVVVLGRTAPPAQRTHTGIEDRSREAAARAEWRANRAFLEKLCTEEAYIAQALRGLSN